MLPGVKAEAVTTPENVVGCVVFVPVAPVLVVLEELSLPPQAASAQAAAIEVKRRVVRDVGLTGIVGPLLVCMYNFFPPEWNKSVFFYAAKLSSGYVLFL
ncbi:hypothetical protein [Paraburkholderia susongensis]|uniref:hypothetical protein n=1 Tax=Paraburkholderia susongensis TaxID=1515439 RepID=UPI001FC9CF8D|nr:hypothetical protein [Paraburkholderia susongensis]